MIEIIESELQIDDEFSIWSCRLEITRTGETYLHSATAPGTLLEADLQAHFEAGETELFAAAQTKATPPDNLYGFVPERILKAFALVVLDEVNLLRSQHGLAQRTPAQLRTAVKNKLKSF